MLKNKVADLFINLAQLIFAGLVLGSVIITKLPALYVLFGGLLLMGVLIVIAVFMYKDMEDE
jgi:uncharacterized membrane protein